MARLAQCSLSNGALNTAASNCRERAILHSRTSTPSVPTVMGNNRVSGGGGVIPRTVTRADSYDVPSAVAVFTLSPCLQENRNVKPAVV